MHVVRVGDHSQIEEKTRRHCDEGLLEAEGEAEGSLTRQRIILTVLLVILSMIDTSPRRRM